MAAYEVETPAPVLANGAVYFGDNGRLVCRECAGASALYTGRDISGQPVERVTIEDVREWQRTFRRDLACEMGCTTLAALVGSDGWPMAKGGAA